MSTRRRPGSTPAPDRPRRHRAPRAGHRPAARVTQALVELGCGERGGVHGAADLGGHAGRAALPVHVDRQGAAEPRTGRSADPARSRCAGRRCRLRASRRSRGSGAPLVGPTSGRSLWLQRCQQVRQLRRRQSTAAGPPSAKGSDGRTFPADKQMRQEILLGRANRTDILMPLLLVRDPSTKDTGTSFRSSTRSRPNRSRRTTSPRPVGRRPGRCRPGSHSRRRLADRCRSG